jgi:hypothetical protein
MPVSRKVWALHGLHHRDCTGASTQEMGRNLAPFFDLKSEAIGRKTAY